MTGFSACLVNHIQGSVTGLLKSPVVVNPSLVEDCGGESLAKERGIHVCGLI